MTKMDLRGEAGSIAPLAIGLGLVSLATILATSCATSFFLLERRLTTLAEFSALAGVEQGMTAVDFVNEGQPAGFRSLVVESDELTDGVTREVVICATWIPPVPGLIQLPSRQLCAKGEARAG